MAVLTGLFSTASAQDQIRWQPNLDTAQKIAAETNRLILVHCWAPWCGPCMVLEKEVFSQAEVGRQLDANFVCVKLNVDESPATARMYHVTSLPTDVVLTPSLRLVAQLQSPNTAQQYVDKVNRIAEGHKQLVAAGGGGGPIAAGAGPAAGAMAAAGAPGAAMAPPAQAPPQQPQPGYGPAPNAQQRYTDDRYAHVMNQPPQQPMQPQQPAAGAPTDNYAGGPYGPQAPQAWQAQQPGSPPPAAPAVPPQAPLSSYTQSPYQSMTPPQAPAPGQPPVPNTPAQAPAQPPVQQPVQQVAATTPQVQLPPGSPPVGLEGFCPVTLTEERRWLPGDRRWGAIHRGRTYLFTGPAQQQRFMANPDIYSPVMSGNDPVMALDARQEASGRREHGVFFDGRIYLFANEQSLEAFNKNPKRYSAEVMQAMR